MAEFAPSGGTVDTDELIRLRYLVGHLPEPKLSTTGHPGSFASRRRGSGIDVLDVRPYVEGDDARHIDAMATARSGKIHVRTFHADRDKTALLIADFRPPMLWGTRKKLRSVAAAEVLALAGWRVVGAGGRIGLLALSSVQEDYLAPRARERAMAQVAGNLSLAHRAALEHAARGKMGGAIPTLDQSLEQASRMMPSGSTVFIATGLDSPGEGFEAAVRGMTRRLRLVVLLIKDAFEQMPPAGAYPYFTRPDQMRWTRLGGGPTSLGEDKRPVWLKGLGADVCSLDAFASLEETGRLLAETVHVR